MKQNILPLASILLFVSLAASQAQDLLKFDFGWKELEPPQGFVKVTKDSVYTAAQGWGFSTNLGWGTGPIPYLPTAFHKHLDAIGRDGIRMYNTFRVDVTNGNYLIWYLEGHVSSYPVQPIWDHAGYGLTLCGQEIRKALPFDKDLFRKEFYAGFERDYRRGDDVFEQKFVPLMDERTAAVTVTNGQLSVTGHALNLCGLMIAPASQKAVFEEQTAALHKLRRDAFYAMVKVREPEPEGQPAALTEADTARGYQIWPRHKMRPVAPNTQPEADEYGDALKAYAAQDQVETVTFAVRPLADLKNVRISVSDLSTPAGDPLAASNLRIRTLVYRVAMDGLVTRSHLRAFAPSDLQADVTRQYWLTLTVPPDAVPGIYAGTVSFAPEGRPATTLTLKVKVLGFPLRDVYQDARFVLQDTNPAMYAYQMKNEFPDDYLTGMAEAYRFLKGYGLLPQVGDVRAATLYAGTPTQQVTFAQGASDLFVGEVEAYRATFPGLPMVVALHRMFSGYWTPMNRGANNWPLAAQPAHHWTAMRQYLEGYNTLRAQHPDWPEFYFVIGAEMNNGGEDHVLFAKGCIEAAKTVPGMRLISCPNGVFEARTCAPLVDVIAPNYAVPMTDQAFAGIPNEKTELWVYQAFNRLCYGFYAERVKATGSFKEWYTSANQRPYNDFDGRDLHGGVALPSPEGPLATPLLEEFGWGVTDFRYVQTLKQTIAQAKASGQPAAVAAAAEAQEFLTALLGDINPDLDYYLNQAGFWDYSVYDTYRWQVAEQILKVQDAL